MWTWRASPAICLHSEGLACRMNCCRAGLRVLVCLGCCCSALGCCCGFCLAPLTLWNVMMHWRRLAQTLQWLEGDGLVDRLAFDVVPPHVEYRLTPLGREAAERVQGLADWIETSLPRILQAQDERRGAQACAR